MEHTYELVTRTIQDITDKLEPYAADETIFKLRQISSNFTMKVEDFHREGRKLNIGVIGRVKAGKSSFLNTLLFHGEEILPKAATPKTATLTKMEYAKENRIVIEFYTSEEWEGIQKDASFGDRDEISRSAKDLVDMAYEREIDVPEILAKGNLEKTFDAYQELLEFLNSYVGENGLYTPLVRSVAIYMDREEFKDISIVDTPGLNDTIPSRTQKTKEFIEICDVVFFLSRAGSFLDANDWRLLCEQLPQKGVKKMVLVASQYDGGLRDVLKKEEKNGFFGKEKSWRQAGMSSSKATNLSDAKKLVEESLEKRAAEKIASFATQPENGDRAAILKVLQDCKKPILISSRAQDMSRKPYEEYSREEKDDYEYWKAFIPEDRMAEEFSAIGNFEEINRIYREIKVEKERLLEEKEKEFIPTVYRELRELFFSLQKETELHREYLQSNDNGSLEEKQSFFESKINAIKADIAEVFGDTIEKIKLQKIGVNKELRDMSIEAATLKTHTGTETHHGTHTSYAFRLGPIRLGRRTSDYTYTTTYKYLAASDALEQINIYGKGAASEIEEMFQKTVEIKAYRRKLLETVIRNIDSSDESFDANYFRILVQNALNNIDFPEVHIDVSKELEEIGNQFSGEVRNDSDQSRFRSVLSMTVENLYQSILDKVERTISDFLNDMKTIQMTFSDEMLGKIMKEFEKVKKDMADKKASIEKDDAYLSLIEEIICELQGR